MARSLDAALVAELSAHVVRIVTLVKLEFDGGTLYLHDDLGTIAFGGNNYLGVGDLGSVGPIEETTEIAATTVNMLLSAIDATIINEALANDFQERPVTIYIGARNTLTGAMVADPDEIWHGSIDEMPVSPTTVELSGVSEMMKWNRSADRYFTDSDLQAQFSGDLGLQFVTRMQNNVVVWGENTVPRLGVPRGRNPAHIRPDFARR